MPREEPARKLSQDALYCTEWLSGGTTISALREISHTPSMLMEIVKGWDGCVWKL